MISKHFSLSCFALENPFQPFYSHSAEMIELIDINHDIYQFRLPDYEHYEKMQANCAIKQYFRYYSISLILYQTNTLIIQKNGAVAVQVENVGMFAIHSGKDFVTVLLRPNVEQKQSTISFRVLGLSLDKNEAVWVSEVKKLLLLSGTELQNYSFQKYVSESSFENGSIQQFFSHFCLLKHNEGLYSIAELVLDLSGRISDTLVKYDIHNYEIPHIQKIIGQYKSTLAILSQNNQNEKQKKSNIVSIIDAEQKQVINLKGFKFQGAKLQYLRYEKFVIVLSQSFLWIFAATQGILLGKIDLAHVLEQVKEDSILNQLEKAQQRYCFLLDESQNSMSQFYLMDKQKISVYKFNIATMIHQCIVGPICSTISTLSDEKDEIHMNVMKTVNFRTKKLNTLQQYLIQGIKTLSFGHTVRFLQNQENIFVLNDGLYLFYKAVSANIEQIAKQRTFIINLEKDIIELCIKLITESKYEGHIFKGLTIANNLYSMLRTNLKVLKNNENVEIYVRMLQSKRAIRLLKQDKNKQLFELCYQLAILVKGYDYLQQIEKKKK